MKINPQPSSQAADSPALLRLSRSVYQSLQLHGEQSYPEECCGALLGHCVGQSWVVSAAIPATNASTDRARDRYQIAPAELIRITRTARERGLEVAGFYHSHPDHPAHWSATDLAEAHWLGCVYLICSVKQGHAAETNAFLLNGMSEEDKHFEPQMLQIDDAEASADGLLHQP